MTSALLDVAVAEAPATTGVFSSTGRQHPLPQPAISAIGLALLGGLTGASSFELPLELLDGTSAHTIEIARPFRPGDYGAVEIVSRLPATATVAPLLEEVKTRSGLTWGHLAEMLNVAPRAIHLWRAGGGISAGHEERLRELHALVDSIDMGDPQAVRSEFLTGGTNSLVDRLRGGESPGALVMDAPWRVEALEALERNIVELQQDDGVLDEDFVFLLHVPDDELGDHLQQAQQMLTTATPRRAWERWVDDQFAQHDPELPVPADTIGAGDGDDDIEITPLFKVADLGIALGVGAIAAGRASREGEL